MCTTKTSSISQSIKRRGFTDRLYWLNFKMVWTFIFIGVLCTVFSGLLGITDMSVFSVGIPVAFAELGVHTTCIINKALKENVNKANLGGFDGYTGTAG